jgi:hypothetical protein
MSWTISHRKEDGIVFIKTTGVHSPADVRMLAQEALAEAMKHKATRYLVDDREMTPDFRTLDIYQLPRIFLDLGVPRESRIATVISEHSPKKEDFKFYETVADNFGGVSVKIFEESFEAAIAWLQRNS